MRFGPRILFEEVSCTFFAGRRYAISGPNGAGKTTLMRILTGDIEPTKGDVTRPKKFGILRQDQFAFDEFRVIDTVIMGNARLWKTLEERDALYAKPHDALTDKDGMRLAELEGIVGEENGYTAESDAAVLLDGLGLEEPLHERKMRELQGGQKVRVLLAQALFGSPPALLLDEPTNHLDLDSVHWLQDYLIEYEGVLIVISHDRHFLNSVCTHTADIDYQTVIMYNGGYDDMVLAKTSIRSRIESENAQRERKIAQLNEFIARFSAGTRSAQATSRKKEVERLQSAELARSNIARPFIRFQMDQHSGRHPLEIKSIAKSYDGVKVIQPFTANVDRGEKIALMGRNGSGKTTLLKSLIRNATGFVEDSDKEFPVDGGTVVWGHNVAVGYFAQDHSDSIVKGMTVIEWLHPVSYTHLISCWAIRTARTSAESSSPRSAAARNMPAASRICTMWDSSPANRAKMEWKSGAFRCLSVVGSVPSPTWPSCLTRSFPRKKFCRSRRRLRGSLRGSAKKRIATAPGSSS